MAWVPAGPDKRAGARVCGGALERGDCAACKPLAQLGDAIRGVGAIAIAADAAERVGGQAASKGEVSVGVACQLGPKRELAS